MSGTYKNVGEEMWKRTEKVNGELFVVTYGSIVTQLVMDNVGDMDSVNQQLDRIGYGMGTRLADDFFSKTMLFQCGNFHDTIDMVCQVGFKMYMGISPSVVFSESQAIVTFDESNRDILTEFVELDNDTQGLTYSQIYCGVIRGALAMLNIRVECVISNDCLVTGQPTQISIRLLERDENSSN